MLAILYILLIIVFLLIVKQFYFSNSEYFHPLDRNVQTADEQNTDHTHSSQATNQRRLRTTRDRGGSSAREVVTEETTGASISETTSSSEESNEITSAVETTSPSDTTQASVNNQQNQQNEQTQDSSQTEQTQETEQNQNNPNGVISESENLRLLFQLIREQRSRPDSTQPVITARADSECCGLTIFNDELQNINLCLDQHLLKQDQSGYQMISNRWKPVDDRSCKNPPHILAKTTNCSGSNSVIAKFYPHLNTLNEIASDLNAQPCFYSSAMSYNESNAESEHRNSDTSNPLSDIQKMSVFTQNIACPLRGQGNIVNTRPRIINGARVQVLGCSGSPG